MASFSICGKNFDVDKFLKNTGFKADSVKHRGEPRNTLPNAPLIEWSCLSKTIYETNFNDLDIQIRSSIKFLEKFGHQIDSAKKYGGEASITFALLSNIYHSNLIQSVYYPSDLLKICAKHNVSLEITLYALDLEKQMDNGWKPVI